MAITPRPSTLGPRPTTTKKYPRTATIVPTASGPAGKVDPPTMTGAGGTPVLKAPRPLLTPPNPVLQAAQPALPADAIYNGGGGAGDGSVAPRTTARTLPAGGGAVSGGTAPGGAAPAARAPAPALAPPVAQPGGSVVTSTAAPPVAQPGGSTVTSGTPAPAPALPPPVTGPANLDPLQEKMREQTMRYLDDPSVYDDELWQREVGRARATYDEETNRQEERLKANLAQRGVEFGDIGGNAFMDFATSRARGFDDILTGFLSDRAQGIGGAREQAFNAGNIERNYYDGLREQARKGALDEVLIGDQLQTSGQNREMQWIDAALEALGAGNRNAAQASRDYGQTGAGAGDANAALMNYLAEFFLTEPKPALPAPSTPTGGS